MAREEYQVAQAPWRNTALPTLLGFVESYAALPLVLWLVDISRLSTLGLALALIGVLTVIRYFGLDARAAYRLLGAFLIQALAGGRVRPSPAHEARSH